MWLKEFRKYLGIFAVGVALIAVYKTFDNFGRLWDGVRFLLSIITPFVIGGIIAYILYIPCRKIEGLCEKTNISFIIKHRRPISAAAIYFIFIAVVTLALVGIIPALVKSITEFMEQLPDLIQGFVSWFNSLEIYTIDNTFVQKLISGKIISIDRLIGGFSFDNMNKYAKGVMSFGAGIFNVFIGLIVSIYLLLDRADLKALFLRITGAYIPEKYRKFFGIYLVKINKFINLYIYCLLIDALIIFILSFIILSIMRVKYAPLLALMLGTFNMIPYFGAITATTLSALITVFTKSFASGISVAVVLIILQQIDANVIQPRLLSESLNVKPVWVILAIMLGGGLFGVAGILLAVPCFALIRIICIDILEAHESKSAAKTIAPENDSGSK